MGVALLAFLAVATVNASQRYVEDFVDLSSDLVVSLDGLTVSGLSSGAAFATQFHVAHSSLVKGAGLLAGIPYGCARNNMLTALYTCMPTNTRLPEAARTTFAKRARDCASKGNCDDPAHLSDGRVFLSHGREDDTVAMTASEATVAFYEEFGSDVIWHEHDDMGHLWPTLSYGTPCRATEPPYLGKCRWNAAYEMLAYLDPSLVQKGAIYSDDIESKGETDDNSIHHHMYRFDQDGFVSNRKRQSVAESGFVFVPPQCFERQCRVHVAFAGCSQQEEHIGRRFVDNAGFNEIAMLNDFVVVYPQLTSSMLLPQNPYGCWDWWGYTGSKYDTQKGSQIDFVHNVLQAMAADVSK
ncbi:MAG: hypothetical protein MHM6MM_004164 [Cercozoa sp. M6MM]